MFLDFFEDSQLTSYFYNGKWFMLKNKSVNILTYNTTSKFYRLSKVVLLGQMVFHIVSTTSTNISSILVVQTHWSSSFSYTIIKNSLSIDHDISWDYTDNKIGIYIKRKKQICNFPLAFTSTLCTTMKWSVFYINIKNLGQSFCPEVVHRCTLFTLMFRRTTFFPVSLWLHVTS